MKYKAVKVIAFIAAAQVTAADASPLHLREEFDMARLQLTRTTAAAGGAHDGHSSAANACAPDNNAPAVSAAPISCFM